MSITVMSAAARPAITHRLGIGLPKFSLLFAVRGQRTDAPQTAPTQQGALSLVAMGKHEGRK